VSGAEDAALGAERLLHGFAERDARVFDGVMLVHVEIAARGEIQIEGAVPRDLLEHVIEKTNAGPDARAALPIQIYAHANLGFAGHAVHGCLSHWRPHLNVLGMGFLGRIRSSSRRNRRACRVVPSVMRTYPSPPKSLERSRTSTRCFARAVTISPARSPNCASTKFPALGK